MVCMLHKKYQQMCYCFGVLFVVNTCTRWSGLFGWICHRVWICCLQIISWINIYTIPLWRFKSVLRQVTTHFNVWSCRLKFTNFVTWPRSIGLIPSSRILDRFQYSIITLCNILFKQQSWIKAALCISQLYDNIFVNKPMVGFFYQH